MRGYALGNHLRRRWSYLYNLLPILHTCPFTGLTGIFRADMAGNPYLGRNELKLLRDIFSNLHQPGSTAADLLLLGNIVYHLYPGKTLWQGPAPALSSLIGGNFDGLYRLCFFVCPAMLASLQKKAWQIPAAKKRWDL